MNPGLCLSMDGQYKELSELSSYASAKDGSCSLPLRTLFHSTSAWCPALEMSPCVHLVRREAAFEHMGVVWGVGR